MARRLENIQTTEQIVKPRRLENIQPDQQTQTDQLLEQLGGKLPTKGKLPAPFVLGGLGAPPGPITRPDIKEQTRRQAYSQLLKQGHTPEQLKLTVQAQKMLGRPRYGRGAGGIIGPLAATAIAGRAIPGPFDDAAILAGLIAAGGAGVAGVAGEAAQTALEEKRLIGKREALKAFAIEAGTEIGARGLVRAGKFAMSPFIKKTVPEAAALVDDFAKVGGTFSPTELDSRFSLRVMEGFSRGSFGAAEIFREFEEKQMKAASVFAKNIIDSIAEGVARQTPKEIGETFAKEIISPNGRILMILDDLVNPLYKQVDDLAKESVAGFRQIRKGGRAIRGVTGRFQPAKELQRIRIGPKVSTKSLKTFANKQLATDKRLNGQFLSPIGRSKMKKIVGMGDDISFSDMRLLRSSYLRDVRKLARDVDQSQGIIKQLAGIADDAIFDPKSTKGLNREALNLLRNTNALYKQGKEGIKTTFSESLMKKLVKNPSSVVKEVILDDNPTAIKLLRESLVEPISGKPSAEGKILWNQIRQAWLANAVEETTKEGVVNPRTYNNIIKKLTVEGFNELFPEPAVRSNVIKLHQLFEVVGKKPPTGLSLFSRGAQTMGVVKMYQGAKASDFIGFTTGGLLSIGPLAFAKMSMNPTGLKLLTAGVKMKPGATGLVPNAVRMIRLLREINAKENKQRLKELRQQQLRGKIAREPTLRQMRGLGGRGF